MSELESTLIRYLVFGPLGIHIEQIAMAEARPYRDAIRLGDVGHIGDNSTDALLTITVDETTERKPGSRPILKVQPKTKTTLCRPGHETFSGAAELQEGEIMTAVDHDSEGVVSIYLQYLWDNEPLPIDKIQRTRELAEWATAVMDSFDR